MWNFHKKSCFIWNPSLFLLIKVAKTLLSVLVCIIISDPHKILIRSFQPGLLCDKLTVVLTTLTGS